MSSRFIAYSLSVIISLLYGFTCQAILRSEKAVNDVLPLVNIGMVMTFGFVFIFPFCLGVITVYFAEEKLRKSYLFQIFMPWITALISLLLSFLAGWEGTICLVLATPIYLSMSSIGGLSTGVFLKFTTHKKHLQLTFFNFVLIAPFLSGVVEDYFLLPSEIRTVNTEIPIHASSNIIWSQITKIPKITEPQEGFFYIMGFPKPLEATLSYEGVGGIREAKFEKGLMFTEKIILWQPNQKLRFTIQSHPESTPLTTLDPHVVVGGKYFDTLLGEYEIESISETESILHLYSQYRISTRFNFYASLWSDFLMRDIQNNILHVLKQRCEKLSKLTEKGEKKIYKNR